MQTRVGESVSGIGNYGYIQSDGGGNKDTFCCICLVFGIILEMKISPSMSTSEEKICNGINT